MAISPLNNIVHPSIVVQEKRVWADLVKSFTLREVASIESFLALCAKVGILQDMMEEVASQFM